jgi:hypothetical protein
VFREAILQYIYLHDNGHRLAVFARRVYCCAHAVSRIMSAVLSQMLLQHAEEDRVPVRSDIKTHTRQDSEMK